MINPLEILQSDWSWWISNNRTKLWIGLIPDLLPGNGRGRRRPTTDLQPYFRLELLASIVFNNNHG